MRGCKRLPQHDPAVADSDGDGATASSRGVAVNARPCQDPGRRRAELDGLPRSLAALSAPRRSGGARKTRRVAWN